MIDLNGLLPYLIGAAIGYVLRPMLANLIAPPAPAPAPSDKLAELLNRLQVQQQAAPLQQVQHHEQQPVEVQLGSHMLKVSSGGVSVAPAVKAK